jgi:hypothetical protein
MNGSIFQNLTSPILLTSGVIMFNGLRLLFDQGIKNKEMKPVIPYVAVLTILSAVRGLEFWHRSQKKYSPQQMEDNMVTHLIRLQM